MPKKTDDRWSEKDIPTGALVSLALLAAGVVLASTLLQSKGVVPGQSFGGPSDIRFIFFHPGIVALSVTVEQALLEFSGETIGVLTPRVTSFLLATILLTGLVGPILFVLALRRRILGERPVLLRASTVLGLVLGGFTCLMTIIMAGAFAWSSRQLTSAVNIQTTADKMMKEVFLISYDARNYRTLPKWLGGGGGTYEGFIPSVPEGSFGRYSFSISPHRISVSAVPKYDPRSLDADPSRGALPEAGISAVIDSSGRIRDWKRSGLFE